MGTLDGNLGKKPSRAVLYRRGVSLLLGSLFGFIVYYTARQPRARSTQSVPQVEDGVAKYAPVLVLYAFADADPDYIHNFHYFVREGVGEGDGADYVFAVKVRPNGEKPTGLPPLPYNAKYLFHSSECQDWGTFGWIFDQAIVRKSDYRYFIFMNSSVRGPFIAPYRRGKMHWTNPFLFRINDVVKLVGSTINCQTEHIVAGVDSEIQQTPHVQSYLLATDEVGLEILLDAGHVFACHKTLQETTYYSELGASSAVLQAGYNLDSLMLRYQGVDWRRKENWACNEKMDPLVDSNYDGVYVNPLEVLFVKLKQRQVGEGSEDTVFLAKKYTLWSEEAKISPTNITINRVGQKEDFPPADPCHRELHKEGCLDVYHYKQVNKDLPRDWSNAQLYEHFFEHGKEENRAHRFTCINIGG